MSHEPAGTVLDAYGRPMNQTPRPYRKPDALERGAVREFAAHPEQMLRPALPDWLDVGVRFIMDTSFGGE